MTKNQHGGNRNNSGRKRIYAEKKVVVSMALTPSVKKYIDSHETSASTFVEQLVRKTKSFKTWDEN